MSFSDLLKQSTVHCPHCKSAFELGPDLEAISKSATSLLDKISGLFDDNPFGALCEEIADWFEVSKDEAIGMLSEALSDEVIRDSIFDFLDETEDS